MICPVCGEACTIDDLYRVALWTEDALYLAYSDENGDAYIDSYCGTSDMTEDKYFTKCCNSQIPNEEVYAYYGVKDLRQY